jgi:DNA-binding NarL/FixJ family response regulator
LNQSADIALVIIDDHEVIHSGVSTWCTNAVPAIRIAGNYLSYQSFLTQRETSPQPVDVVLLDLELSSREPRFDALEKLTQAGYRVIVYSHLEHTEIILSCLDLGAVTYLVKTEGKAHLLDAIHAAASDEPYVGPRMASAMANDSRSARPRLSDKEIQVLKAWFQTESKDIVGQRLYVSPATVKTHLQRVRAKYAAAGRPATTKAALLARAVQDGIISINDI